MDKQLNLRLAVSVDPHPAIYQAAADLLASSEAGYMSSGEKSAPVTTRNESDRVRRSLCRYTLIAAHACGLSPSMMWILVYHHIAKTLKEHPVVISQRNNLPTHLDALMQIPGGPEEAMAYLVGKIEGSVHD